MTKDQTLIYNALCEVRDFCEGAAIVAAVLGGDVGAFRWALKEMTGYNRSLPHLHALIASLPSELTQRLTAWETALAE